jgi:hypothetical protein
MNSPTTAAEEAQISLAERKVSAGMRRALENLMNILQCPLCSQVRFQEARCFPMRWIA